MRTLIAATLAILAAVPAIADETEGLVLAYDRQANVLVLTDKTIWSLPSEITLPEDLIAGDRVHLVYDTAGEDGLTKIEAIHRLAMALPEGTDGGS
ncbi:MULTISPECIES: hypothetical protein [unclassified Marinovum]